MSDAGVKTVPLQLIWKNFDYSHAFFTSDKVTMRITKIMRIFFNYDVL